MDGGDVTDFQAWAPRCFAADRLWRAERIRTDVWAASEEQGIRRLNAGEARGHVAPRRAMEAVAIDRKLVFVEGLRSGGKGFSAT